jgi:type I restriction enzyme S subunit
MKISLGARHDFLHKYGVPEGWTASEIRDLAEVVGGATPSREESRYWNGGQIAWATPTDLTSNNSKYISETSECISETGLASCAATILPVGSVLYTSRATIGAKAIARVPITTNQGFASFIPKNVDGEYLYYLLDLLTPTIKRLGAGTTFDEVSRRDIRKLWCAIPPLEEQAAIARILDTVDKAIELTRKTIERAQSLKTALLVNAFDRLKVEKRRLGEFTTEVRYGTSQAASKQGWGHPTLRIPNVIGDQLALDDLVCVDLNPEEVARLTLRDGDLLMVRTNGNPSYVGRSVVFKAPDDRAWIYASYLIRVRLNEELLPDYVNIFLSMERGRRELFRRVTTSAGNYNINSNNIRLLTIPVPASKAEQEHIVKIAKTCRAYVGGLQRKLVALTDLKKALMRDLLTGKVRVNNLNLAATAIS